VAFSVLLSDLTVVLGPGAGVVLPHTLILEALPVAPTSVLPDRGTPIVVSAATTTTVTFANSDLANPQTAVFRCEFTHTIQRSPLNIGQLLWQGTAAGGGGGAAVLNVKNTCRLATTANIAVLTGLAAIDGFVPVAGDRILVKNQVAAATNGIYTAAAGAWPRSVDADTSVEVTAGMFTWVAEGATQADTGWLLITDDPIVLGVTALTFTKFQVVTIQDEGALISTRPTLNFIGAGVAAVDNPGANRVDITVSSTTGGGVAGQVAFWSAATVLAGDNDLFWDNVTKRLGIGTATPTVELQVVGDVDIDGVLTVTLTNAAAFTVQDAGLVNHFNVNTLTGEVTIPGKLTVGGAIDPTHLFLNEQVADPTVPANEGVIYTKQAGAQTQLFYRADSDGIVTQLTGGNIMAPGDSTLLSITTTQQVTPLELAVGLYRIFAPAALRFKQAASWCHFAATPTTPTVSPSIPGARAQLALGPLSNGVLNTVVRARLVGTAGNSITMAALNDGGAPAVRASLALGPLSNNVIDTVVEAIVAGAAGNGITVSSAADSGGGVIIEEPGGDLVHIRFDDGVSTVADIEAAIPASTLIQVQTPGTGANVPTGADVWGATNLGGGSEILPFVTEAGTAVTIHYAGGTSTVAQIEVVINAQSLLTEVLTPGTQANVVGAADDFLATLLAGGANGTTTYSYVVVAVMPDGGKSAASAVGTTVLGQAALGGPNFNTLDWPDVAGASSYDIYKTVGPLAQGLIGTSVASLFVDTGFVGDGTTAPTTATSIGILVPAGMYSDLLTVNGPADAFFNARSISGTVIMEFVEFN
jgi:hypothetical protein